MRKTVKTNIRAFSSLHTDYMDTEFELSDQIPLIELELDDNINLFSSG